MVSCKGTTRFRICESIPQKRDCDPNLFAISEILLKSEALCDRDNRFEAQMWTCWYELPLQ